MNKIKNLVFKYSPIFFLQLNHRITHKNNLQCWRECDYIFLHVPKSAGTSINRALGKPDLGHLTFEQLSKIDIIYKKKKAYFCIYRNPTSRLRSTYQYALKAFAEKGYSSLSAISDFPTFNNFVEKYLSSKTAEKHFFLRSTSAFIKGSPKEKTYIINFNSLKSKTGTEKIERLIGNITGEKVTIPHLNQTTNIKTEIDANAKKKIEILYKNDLILESKLGDKFCIKYDELNIP